MNISNNIVIVAFFAALTTLNTASAASNDVSVSLVPSESLTSQYMVGPSSPTIATYNFTDTNPGTIQELKFNISGALGAVSMVSITTGGQTVGVPVINSVADIQGLSIPVPAGAGGVNIFVTPTYTTIGGPNGLSSNSPATIALSYVKSLNPNTAYVTTSSTSVASSTMTLVSTKPMVMLVSGDNSNPINGQVKLADVLVAADQNGNLGITQIPLSIKTTGNVNLANQSLIVKDANGNVVPTAIGNLLAITANSTGQAIISFLPNYTIGAGSLQDFKIFANAQGVIGNAGTNDITTVLGSASQFIWSDINGNATGLTGNLLTGGSYSPTVPEPTTVAFLLSGAIVMTLLRKK